MAPSYHWTNVDLSSQVLYEIRLWAIAPEIVMNLILDIYLENIFVKLLAHFPRHNEFINGQFHQNYSQSPSHSSSGKGYIWCILQILSMVNNLSEALTTCYVKFGIEVLFQTG